MRQPAMSMCLRILGLPAVLLACATHRAADSGVPWCRPGPTTLATVPTPEVLTALTGTFDLVMVQTVPRGNAPLTEGELELWNQDTARVWRYPLGSLPDSVRRAHPELGRWIAGAFQREPPDTTEAGRRLASRDTEHPGITWAHGVLRFGMVDALDGTGDDLSIEWIRGAAFGGRWQADLGIAMMIDAQGQRVPNPEGYFCARRVASGRWFDPGTNSTLRMTGRKQESGRDLLAGQQLPAADAPGTVHR